MKAFVVSSGDGADRPWGWIVAETAHQIEAAFHGIVIHDPPPDWATPELMDDFGAYKVEGPLDPWLEKLRRS